MKVRHKKKKSMSPKTFKKLYFESGPPSPKHQRFTFFIDIEHWTQSLMSSCFITHKAFHTDYTLKREISQYENVANLAVSPGSESGGLTIDRSGCMKQNFMSTLTSLNLSMILCKNYFPCTGFSLRHTFKT